MRIWNRYTVALTGIVLLSSGLWGAPASAKPKKEKIQTTPAVTVPASGSGSSTTQPSVQRLTLSSNQRAQLIDLLRGKTTQKGVLSDTTRTQIINQLATLPPGIQKQLLRGKGLPPGIAKKIYLPKQVNTYLNLPTRYDLIVMGSNVVMYDAVASIVVDFVSNISL